MKSSFIHIDVSEHTKSQRDTVPYNLLCKNMYTTYLLGCNYSNLLECQKNLRFIIFSFDKNKKNGSILVGTVDIMGIDILAQ